MRRNALPWANVIRLTSDLKVLVAETPEAVNWVILDILQGQASYKKPDGRSCKVRHGLQPLLKSLYINFMLCLKLSSYLKKNYKRRKNKNY